MLLTVFGDTEKWEATVSFIFTGIKYMKSHISFCKQAVVNACVFPFVDLLLAIFDFLFKLPDYKWSNWMLVVLRNLVGKSSFLPLVGIGSILVYVLFSIWYLRKKLTDIHGMHMCLLLSASGLFHLCISLH